MKIIEHQKLVANNLVSLRKTMNATDVQMNVEQIFTYIESCGAKKVGGNIMLTHSAHGDCVDIELYFPIDIKIPSAGEFVFQPQLQVDNCVKVTHRGNPQLLQQTAEHLDAYLAANSLTPISGGYMVSVREVSHPEDMDLFEADVYVPVHYS